MHEQPIDVAILTVIPEELRAVRRALKVQDNAREKDNRSGTIYYRAVTRSELKRRDYRIILTCIGQAGNPSAAAATDEIIKRYNPRVVLLVGIAAGIRGKVKIGEVVLSERVVAYEPAAIVQTADGTSKEQPRPDIPEPPHTIMQDVVNYGPDTAKITRLFLDSGRSFPAAPAALEAEYREHVAKEITVKNSTIASGEKLLRDPSKLLMVRESQHGKIEVGEMEAAGFAKASSRAGVPWLVIRGISDFGDQFKDDRFHEFAAAAAAAVLADFLKHGLDLTTRNSAALVIAASAMAVVVAVILSFVLGLNNLILPRPPTPIPSTLVPTESQVTSIIPAQTSGLVQVTPTPGPLDGAWVAQSDAVRMSFTVRNDIISELDIVYIYRGSACQAYENLEIKPDRTGEHIVIADNRFSRRLNVAYTIQGIPDKENTIAIAGTFDPSGASARGSLEFDPGPGPSFGIPCLEKRSVEWTARKSP